MMAKDGALTGPVSKPDGTFYESSEEIRERDAAKAAAAEIEMAEEEAAPEPDKESKEEVLPTEPASIPTETPPASVRVQRIRDAS
jgi:hypothetical protein